MPSLPETLEVAGSGASESIYNWILSTLSKPEKALNDLPPCPYAKEALVKKELMILEPKASEFKNDIKQLLSRFDSFRKRVLILCCDPSAMSVQETQQLIIECRQQFAAQDLWIMYDHPEIEEKVGNVDFSQGKYLIFFIQKLSDVVEKADDLFAKGYYKNWPKEYFTAVVLKRKEALRLKESDQDSEKLTANEKVF